MAWVMTVPDTSFGIVAYQSASTGTRIGGLSASTGTLILALSASTGTRISTPSPASTWVKGNSLGLAAVADYPDFCYIVTGHNPVITNSVLPVCLVTAAEQP